MMQQAQVDHLVVVATSLDQGVAWRGARKHWASHPAPAANIR